LPCLITVWSIFQLGNRKCNEAKWSKWESKMGMSSVHGGKNNWSIDLPKLDPELCLEVYSHNYLHKIWYFTNLNLKAILGWFLLLTMISGFGRLRPQHHLPSHI
jgi:hypothetical protein